jgi:sulfur transfer protein SufE
MSRTQGSEITRAMEEQKELEQRFEALVTARATLRTMPNKNKLKEVGVPGVRSESVFANGSEDMTLALLGDP